MRLPIHTFCANVQLNMNFNLLTSIQGLQVLLLIARTTHTKNISPLLCAPMYPITSARIWRLSICLITS